MHSLPVLNVVVVVPSGPHWLADFGTSLISLMGHFMNTPVKGYSSHQFRVVNIKSSVLPKSRLNGLKAAKQIGASHLLYLDCDHTFPPDLLNRMLAWKKDCVAVNCVTKSIPATTTARGFVEGDTQGETLYSDEDQKGELQRVWRIGTGVMLLSARAIKQIPHDAFGMTYKPDADTYQGEDWTLCENMEKLGIPIYVDHGLSREVGHVGMFNYTHDYVGQIIKE